MRDAKTGKFAGAIVSAGAKLGASQMEATTGTYGLRELVTAIIEKLIPQPKPKEEEKKPKEEPKKPKEEPKPEPIRF